MGGTAQVIVCFGFLTCIWAENKKCPDGMFRHPLKYVCTSCDVCDPGRYAVKSCENFDNSVCQPCPNGTFSDRSSFKKNFCHNCTLCTNYRSQCSRTKDAICSEEKRAIKAIHIVLPVSVACFLMISVLCIAWSCRKRVRKPPPSSCNELESMRPKDQD